VDCLELVKRLQAEDMDRSIHMAMIEEIKTLLKSRQTYIIHVKSCQHSSSYFMTNFARTNTSMAVWFFSGPEGLAF
jgi:hypothetical protein